MEVRGQSRATGLLPLTLTENRVLCSPLRVPGGLAWELAGFPIPPSSSHKGAGAADSQTTLLSFSVASGDLSPGDQTWAVSTSLQLTFDIPCLHTSIQNYQMVNKMF